jgi:two-component system cell cycle response regulator CtrA
MSRGFGFGADAYITVPHGSDGTPCAASKELIACIYRLTGSTRKPPLVINAGGFTLEFNARWLKINGERVLLCGSEFRIVELLARRRGEIFSKEVLCAYLHKGTDDPEHKIADFFISRARKIMAFHTAGHNLIETVWGKGYRFGESKSSTP